MTTTHAPVDPVEETTSSFEDARREYEANLSPSDRIAYEAGLREGVAQSLCSQLVYDARTNAGLAQTDLADRAGTRQAVISHIENGQVPTIQMLLRIADAVGQPLSLRIGDAEVTHAAG